MQRKDGTFLNEHVQYEAYPRIGQRVKYARIAPDYSIEQGEGNVTAIILDASRRIMAHVLVNEGQADQKALNVDVACLNPTDDFLEKITDTAKVIQELTDRGNAAAREIITDANGRIELLYTNLVGVSVELDKPAE